jgi:hypothetical protein
VDVLTAFWRCVETDLQEQMGLGGDTIAPRCRPADHGCGEEKQHENENENESASEGCLRNRGPSVSHSDLCMKNEGQERGQVGHCLWLSGILLATLQNPEEDIK